VLVECIEPITQLWEHRAERVEASVLLATLRLCPERLRHGIARGQRQRADPTRRLERAPHPDVDGRATRVHRRRSRAMRLPWWRVRCTPLCDLNHNLR